MSRDVVLEVRHLSKSFGANAVLKDIDFTVHPGDVTSIIGSSGSGKSTLLRCINLLETPTSGDVLFHGDSIVDKKVNGAAYRAKVGMVFQSFNLFNNMSVLDNCIIGQTKVLKRDKKEAKEKAMQYLTKVGMNPYINAKPRQLSGGQPLPVRWPWSRRYCCLMNLPLRLIPRWWEKYWRLCADWQRKA